MINGIWLLLLLAGTVVAIAQGNVEVVGDAALKAARDSVRLLLDLSAIIALWSGVMRIAERARLTEALSRLIGPAIRRLFPSIPQNDPAMGAITLALSANMLGLGNAATPLGLKAMEELRRLNGGSPRASDAMCTFLALQTSSVTLFPGTVIALRAAAGSTDPAGILVPTLIATFCSTAVALLADRVARGA